MEKLKKLTTGQYIYDEENEYLNSAGAHLSDLQLQKRALIQLDKLSGVIYQTDKFKDLEKYQKKSVKQIRQSITDLVKRRNCRVQGREKVLTNKGQEQNITLDNIRAMTTHENKRTFDYRFGAILHKNKMAKLQGKIKGTTTDSYWNDFNDNFMYKSGNYSAIGGTKAATTIEQE